jgi:hypothetical protein
MMKMSLPQALLYASYIKGKLKKLTVPASMKSGIDKVKGLVATHYLLPFRGLGIK